MRWTAVLVGATAAVLVSGCGGGGQRTVSGAPVERAGTSTTSTTVPLCPSTDEIARRANTAPVPVAMTSPTILGDGLRLDPPPDGVAPTVTVAAAYESLRASLGSDPGPRPTVALGLFSDDVGMVSGGQHLVQDRLSWVFVFSDTTVGSPSGPPTHEHPPPCNLGRIVTAVDARSGATVLRVETGGPGIAGDAAPDARPDEARCTTQREGGGHAVASYVTTVGAVRAWLDRGDVKAGDDRFPGRQDDEQVVLCWYDDADIAKSPPGSDSRPARPMDRYAAIIDDRGESTLVVAGNHRDLPIEHP